ncbi:MAG: LCP family protein [Bacteroidota bacterium]
MNNNKIAKNPNNNKKKLFLILFISAVIITISVWVVFPDLLSSHNSSSNKNNSDTTANKELTAFQKDSIRKKDSAFIKATSIDADSNENVIRVSNPEDLNAEYQIDNTAGSTVKRIYTGRRINIAVIGVDSRLGATCKHADANHILSILVDQGKIEITSIPRDTPADAEMPDSSGQNKLTIVYANRGVNAYLKEAARIAGVDKIHYYVEVGFSQALGVIELFGFKDPRSTLQVLRSRKGLGGDDYQRSYNQGQFIRQMMLNHFGKTSGLLGDVFVRGGLAIVNTNLNYDVTKDIISKLASKGFPKSPDDIWMRVRPPVKLDYKVYDFSNHEVLSKLRKKIESFNKYEEDKDTTDTTFKKRTYNSAPRLGNAIAKSVKDSAKYPARVVQNLKVYFDQRAWMQVNDKKEREKYRDQICVLLSNAYNKQKKNKQAQYIIDAIEAEKKVFSVPNKQVQK